MNMRTMRDFLRDDLRLQLDFSRSDQNRGIAPPPAQKPVREDQTRIPLPGDPATVFAGRVDLVRALAERKSHRAWRDEPLRSEELGFLLWAVQGVRRKGGPARSTTSTLSTTSKFLAPSLGGLIYQPAQLSAIIFIFLFLWL